MEGISMMLLTLPVTYQIIVLELGFDPIWYGVALVLLVECALITPPVGVNLFVMHGIARHERFEQLIKGVMPFFVILLVGIVILTIFPAMVTWLPGVIMPRH